MRVRLLKDAGTRYGSFPAGAVLDIPNSVAWEWVRTGLAVEDKSINGGEEMKAKPPNKALRGGKKNKGKRR